MALILVLQRLQVTAAEAAAAVVAKEATAIQVDLVVDPTVVLARALVPKIKVLLVALVSFRLTVQQVAGAQGPLEQAGLRAMREQLEEMEFLLL